MKIEINHTEKKIAYLLERISQIFRTLQLELAKKKKLTPLQIQILLFLRNRKQGEVVPSRIAEEFGLTKATISESISSLEKKRLITGMVSDKDRRLKTLSLTLSGKKIIKELSSVESLFERYLERFNEVDKKISFKFLINIISALYFDGYIRVARLCSTCQHFQKDAISKGLHFCSLTSRELRTEEIKINCDSYITSIHKKGGVQLCYL